MENTKFVYGPVPSRRLGLSLGISPIPKKSCNYSCIYCQLGRTNHLTNTRELFFSKEEILAEFKSIINSDIQIDAVTIVGEGEPTLYAGLGDLITEIKKITAKPVALITNGSLLSDENVQNELLGADIILPSLDAYDVSTFKKINRPHGKINFEDTLRGLQTFSKIFSGQIWIEIMLIDGINDDDSSLNKFKELLKTIKYQRLYLNTPIRPPAEENVIAISNEKMNHAVEMLGGISIDLLHSEGFHSEISDDYEAILSIIRRHPMNQFEIEGFLISRGNNTPEKIIGKLTSNKDIEMLFYKGFTTFRFR